MCPRARNRDSAPAAAVGKLALTDLRLGSATVQIAANQTAVSAHAVPATGDSSRHHPADRAAGHILTVNVAVPKKAAAAAEKHIAVQAAG